MKKTIRLLSLFIVSLLLWQRISAFTDINPNSALHKYVQSALEREILDDGGFFRSSAAVPAEMFWKVVLRDAEFNPDSATFHTPLPPNIALTDPLAQYLREAIRRGFINHKIDFDKTRAITKAEALRVLVKTKALLPPKITSAPFRKLFPILNVHRSLRPLLETAYASGLLKKHDVTNFRDETPLTRKELMTWIYNFHTEGEAQTKIGVNNLRPNIQKNSRKKSTSIKVKNVDLSSLLQTQRSTNSVSIPDLQLLKVIFADAITDYRFADEVDEKQKKEMISAATQAMIKALGDKYSVYLPPDKSESFVTNLSGNFEGIGAYVEYHNDQVLITAPIKGSPAEKAGILPGDIVTEVDGKSLTGLSLSRAVKLIKGPAGTRVRLQIKRKNGSSQLIIVTRGKITVPSVTLTWKDSVPILGLHQFNKDTEALFQQIVKDEILPLSPRGIVLDLRNNPGGYLFSAQGIAEVFAKKGEKIFSVDYKEGQKEYLSRRNGELSSLQNIVVLQNEGTASASEIVAGMLQDSGRAQIVGTKSLGKGTVQKVRNYSNGSLLKITVAKWLTPKGRWINETGLIPDIKIPSPTAEERMEKIDSQLAAAINVVLGR